MTQLPPPPVPAHLREMLQDYPRHIERLQEVLTYSIAKSFSSLGLFDQVIWALESRLDSFISEAKDELIVAKQGENLLAIEQAEQKVHLMFRAASKNGGMQRLDDLWEYCQAHPQSHHC